MKHVLVLVLALMLGCVHTYEMQSTGGSAPGLRLPGDSSFWVGVPENGRFGTRVYAGSGLMTAQAIVSALLARVRSAKAAEAPASTEASLAVARSGEFQYFIQPAILHWEDRATEWSGRRDRISVRLDLIDVSSGEMLDSTVVSGKSRWATLGGDHPQELLPEPLDRYVEAILAQ